MIRLEGPGQLVRHVRYLVAGLLAVERGVQVDALAAAGHRHRLQTHALQDRARQACHLGALRQTRALARVEVEHETVGVLLGASRTEPPLRNVDLERADLAEPGQGGEVVHQRVRHRAVGVFDVPAGDPVGCALVEVLLEEHLARGIRCSDAMYPAFARGRAVMNVRQHDRPRSAPGSRAPRPSWFRSRGTSLGRGWSAAAGAPPR